MSGDRQQYSDKALIIAIQKGDEIAFKELYSRHWEKMADYIIKVIKSPEDAKDIVQEIFISIWRRRQTIEIKGEVISYLLKSARNLSIRYIEKNLNKQSILPSIEHHFYHVDILAFTPLELKELENVIHDAIESLPKKMQEIFKLSRFENLSYREIAEKLNIADNTVKKQISNALKMIKNKMDKNDAEILGIFLLLFFSTKK